jgi:cell division protein FtsI (penicillin-binding protein 3)
MILLLVVAGLWIGGLGLRLVWLQVLRHEGYLQAAARQQHDGVELRGPRGTIYDVRGRVLAVSVPADSAWADPKLLPDPSAMALGVVSILGGDAEELARQLTAARDDGSRFFWLGRKLEPPQVTALEALALPGLYFMEESRRYYPMGSLAASVLGFVGTDDLGLAGLELTREDVLAGQVVRRTLLRDARLTRAAPPDLPFPEVPPGGDLHLTLDAALQHIVEDELARTVQMHRARGGSSIWLDPRDGRVLAMASYPGFDPNRFGRYERELWRNRVIEDAYEPGSTFKMVTAAAALKHNVLDPTDELDCQMGSIRVSGTRINDHKPFGILTFRDVIARSSNVGAILAGLRVGPEDLHRMAGAFGFGRPTGIDLPGESAGILHPADGWRPVHTANVAFGQGVSVTPIQLALAFAAIADGGVSRRPWVVAAAGSDHANGGGQVIARPVSQPVAREVERMLEAVVEGGTGQRAAVPGYAVAGKTGTAQKALEDGRGYAAGRYIASFVGFVPARDPVLVGLVMIDEPRPPAYHGGQVAAPAFGAIARRALLYLGVPREPATPEVPAPAVLARDANGGNGGMAPEVRDAA